MKHAKRTETDYLRFEVLRRLTFEIKLQDYLAIIAALIIFDRDGDTEMLRWRLDEIEQKAFVRSGAYDISWLQAHLRKIKVLLGADPLKLRKHEATIRTKALKYGKAG